ncbi:MAG TPA: hypothetical protein VFH31_05290 [Pyrinomonadaceae bacterium]|nr:hypothetical protein [Pyrinomonadaceae bacterium]
MKKEKKSDEQIRAEQQEIAMLVERISAMASHIPKEHATWSYQRTLDFKDAIRRAQAELRKARKNVVSLRSVNGTLCLFYPH